MLKLFTKKQRLIEKRIEILEKVLDILSEVKAQYEYRGICGAVMEVCLGEEYKYVIAECELSECMGEEFIDWILERGKYYRNRTLETLQVLESPNQVDARPYEFQQLWDCTMEERIEELKNYINKLKEKLNENKSE